MTNDSNSVYERHFRPHLWPRTESPLYQELLLRHVFYFLILTKICFTNLQIAICGRSGSGKSTLLLSCVGATSIRSGRVLVDDADSARVPLRPLRHRIVVLPQDPIMFSGTLRENLDPLAVHTDEEIWQSLKAVGLYEFVTAQTAGLGGFIKISSSRKAKWNTAN